MLALTRWRCAQSRIEGSRLPGASRRCRICSAKRLANWSVRVWSHHARARGAGRSGLAMCVLMNGQYRLRDLYSMKVYWFCTGSVLRLGTCHSPAPRHWPHRAAGSLPGSTAGGPAPALERRGLWLGFAGGAHFCDDLADDAPGRGRGRGARSCRPCSLPQDGPRWPGLLSVAYLLLVRAPWLPRRHWLALAVSAAGTVIGFPLVPGPGAARRWTPCMPRWSPGCLPLATALVAALAFRQRPSRGFWVCAVAGCAFVLGFAAVQGRGRLSMARWPAAAGGGQRGRRLRCRRTHLGQRAGRAGDLLGAGGQPAIRPCR